jgi:transcriptional regulator with XRE-family HTH domain
MLTLVMAESGIHVRDLARAAGIGPARVERIRAGRASATAAEMQAIAAAVHLDATDVFLVPANVRALLLKRARNISMSYALISDR